MFFVILIVKFEFLEHFMKIIIHSVKFEFLEHFMKNIIIGYLIC